MADGIVELDVTEPELTVLLEALNAYSGDLASRSEVLRHDARHRRQLADKFPRGRLANRRTAGELEHQASAIDTHADRAKDLVRVISGLRSSSNSQQPTPSQTEE